MRKIIYCSLLLSLVVVLSSCNSGSERPTRYVLSSVTSQNEKAERVNSTMLKWVHSAFFEIKNKSPKSFFLTSDNLKVLPVVNVSDSILSITERSEYRANSPRKTMSGSDLSCRKYIFHKNGDLEVFMGNDDCKYINLYIDGETGLVLEYQKKDFGAMNNYYVDSSGDIVIGNDYGQLDGGLNGRLATRTFDFAVKDIQKCLD